MDSQGHKIIQVRLSPRCLHRRRRACQMLRCATTAPVHDELKARALRELKEQNPDAAVRSSESPAWVTSSWLMRWVPPSQPIAFC